MSETWCPMLNAECRDDCAWADIEYEFDEDGIGREVLCAVAVIAGHFLYADADEDDTFG